jgi:hypothetical protein
MLEIEPLRDDAEIYLEIPPVFHNHVACRLDNIRVEYKYSRQFGEFIPVSAKLRSPDRDIFLIQES